MDDCPLSLINIIIGWGHWTSVSNGQLEGETVPLIAAAAELRASLTLFINYLLKLAKLQTFK
jgi:hypothetical protein